MHDWNDLFKLFITKTIKDHEFLTLKRVLLLFVFIFVMEISCCSLKQSKKKYICSLIFLIWAVVCFRLNAPPLSKWYCLGLYNAFFSESIKENEFCSVVVHSHSTLYINKFSIFCAFFFYDSLFFLEKQGTLVSRPSSKCPFWLRRRWNPLIFILSSNHISSVVVFFFFFC